MTEQVRLSNQLVDAEKLVRPSLSNLVELLTREDGLRIGDYHFQETRDLIDMNGLRPNYLNSDTLLVSHHEKPLVSFYWTTAKDPDVSVAQNQPGVDQKKDIIATALAMQFIALQIGTQFTVSVNNTFARRVEDTQNTIDMIDEYRKMPVQTIDLTYDQSSQIDADPTYENIPREPSIEECVEAALNLLRSPNSHLGGIRYEIAIPEQTYDYVNTLTYKVNPIFQDNPTE